MVYIVTAYDKRNHEFYKFVNEDKTTAYNVFTETKTNFTGDMGDRLDFSYYCGDTGMMTIIDKVRY